MHLTSVACLSHVESDDSRCLLGAFWLCVASVRLHFVILLTLFPVRRELRKLYPTETEGRAVPSSIDQDSARVIHVDSVQCTSAYMSIQPSSEEDLVVPFASLPLVKSHSPSHSVAGHAVNL